MRIDAMAKLLVVSLLVVWAGVAHGATELQGRLKVSGAKDVLDLIGGHVVPGWVGNVTMWPGGLVSGPHSFVFPELSGGDFGIPALQAKPNFGIGCSGGGLRALSLSMGWLRGMYQLGLLQKARYLGSASGGSLANVMVSYTEYSKWGKRFGPYVPPHKLNIKALRTIEDDTFLGIVKDMDNFYQTFLECLLRVEFEAPPAAGGYTRAITQLLLQPLGIGAHNSTWTAMGTRGAVHERVGAIAKQLGLEVYAAMASPEQPFPLITGNVYDSNTDIDFFPMEFTPLYVATAGNFSGYATQGPIGGGLIEPLGFNAKPLPGARPVHSNLGGPATLAVKSSYAVPLVSQVAVSGGILAVMLDGIIRATPGPGTAHSAAAGMPFFNMINFENMDSVPFPFVDGGYLDNQGMWAMLRRKVQKILVFYACASGSSNITEWGLQNTGLSLPFGACADCYASLNTSTPLTNKASQVFGSEHYLELFDAYQANMAAGKPNFWRKKLAVRENAFMGVPGGWEVDLMVVMAARTSGWEEQLPPDTKELLRYSRSAEAAAEYQTHPLTTYKLVGFPHTPITIFRYTATPLSALSNLATWQVLQLQGEIRDFLQGA